MHQYSIKYSTTVIIHSDSQEDTSTTAEKIPRLLTRSHLFSSMKLATMISALIVGSARAFVPRTTTAFARVGTHASYSSSSSLMANPMGTYLCVKYIVMGQSSCDGRLTGYDCTVPDTSYSTE